MKNRAYICSCGKVGYGNEADRVIQHSVHVALISPPKRMNLNPSELYLFRKKHQLPDDLKDFVLSGQYATYIQRRFL